MAPPLYFHDEADEGEESVEEEESGSDQDDGVGPTGIPLNNYSRKAIKICRHFSYALINNAVDMGWEEEEIASLIKLVANQLNFDEAKLIRCLEKTGTGSPNTIASLLTNSGYSFSAAQLVSVILSNARNVDHFITLMGEAFECDLFKLSHPETIDTLYSFVGNNMDYRESQRYARQLCEHSDSKRVCGRVLHKFTSALTPAEAAAYMYDIITLDFFQDVRGSTHDLMKEIPRAQEQLQALLHASHNLDQDGELVDSDADSEGNLRDFVVNSDSEEGGSRGSGSDSGSESGSRSGSGGHSSGSEGSGSDSDEEDLQNKHRKPQSAPKRSSDKIAKGASSKSSKQTVKKEVQSEEEDWQSDHSGGSGSEGSTGGSSSGSDSQPAKQTVTNNTKPAKSTANSAIKAASTLKRKRIEDSDGSEEESEAEEVVRAKKAKGSAGSVSRAGASVVKGGKNKRVVCSDSDGESSATEVKVEIKVEGKGKHARPSIAASDSSSDIGSNDSSDSDGSDSSDRAASTKKTSSTGSKALSAKKCASSSDSGSSSSEEGSDSSSSNSSASVVPPSTKSTKLSTASSKNSAISSASSATSRARDAKDVKVKLEPGTVSVKKEPLVSTVASGANVKIKQEPGIVLKAVKVDIKTENVKKTSKKAKKSVVQSDDEF